jgi:hypothetical protein
MKEQCTKFDIRINRKLEDRPSHWGHNEIIFYNSGISFFLRTFLFSHSPIQTQVTERWSPSHAKSHSVTYSAISQISG